MQLSDAMFYRIRVWMKEQTGVHFPDSKKTLVHQRLLKRLSLRKIASFEAYFRLLQQPEEEQERLAAIDLLTTHETFFFREPRHFEWLSDWLGSRPRSAQPLRIWSAACASGEEVWSLAMLLADKLGYEGNWQVMGSDISQASLDKARSGHYQMARIEGLPRDYLHRFCLKGVREYTGTFLVNRQLRARVCFDRINLDQHLPPIGHFDLVFLRNVLIYFDTESKISIIGRVLQHIHEGGFLLVSHSESLHGLGLPLKLLKPGVYRKSHE